MKALLYCTKGKPYLLCNPQVDSNKPCRLLDNSNKKIYDILKPTALNGTIPCECDYEISEIELHQAYFNYGYFGPAYFTKRKEPFKYFSYIDLLKASCLQDNEMLKYLGNKNGKAIHIKNLHIFDEPKELNEYCNLKCSKCGSIKAPQNMMYVYKDNIKYALISIHPEHLCNILNGVKTIEVRKKTLKYM